MKWVFGILLAVALSVESYSVNDQYERLAHGRQLRIFLPKGSERLEFVPADDPSKTLLFWERGGMRPLRGRVSGTGNDRRWYIDQVTYEDQGTYTQKDFWNKEISTVRVAIIPRNVYLKRIAGESLYISLEGIHMDDATLSFSGDANVTLVRDGSRVSQDLPDYFDRVKTSGSSIEIKNVNFSDVGHYTLRDRRHRVVSITRMDLTDHHEHTKGSPLMALLLLLGIPAWICCCCRKKIFRTKANNAAALQTLPVPDAVPPPSVGPVGPCPQYNVHYHGPDATMGPSVHPPPPVTGPAQWNSLPPADYNPAYPPYPPAGAAGIPPAHPPQWNGQYPTGPAPPVGYAPAPVMYSSPPPATASEPVKASSPAEPLLNATPQAEAASHPGAPVPPSANTLTGSDATYQFRINGNDSTNFL